MRSPWSIKKPWWRRRQLITSLVVVVFTAIFYTLFMGPGGSSDQYEPTNGTVVLIDRTDGITLKQQIRFMKEFNYLRSQLKPGDYLAVYEVIGNLGVIDGGLSDYSPLYRSYVPRQGKDANEWIENPRMIDQEYQRFENELKESVLAVKFSEECKNSYIIESIRFIVRTLEFRDLDNKKLVIFSNMLQNSETLTHYGQYRSVAKLAKESYVMDIEGMMHNTEVYVYILPDNSGRQDIELRKWWEEYFDYLGVHLLKLLRF